MPSGKFLMEDFYYAGGVPAVVRALGELINRDALTVNGKTMGENTADAPCWNAEVIRQPGQSRQRACRHCRAARQPGPGWRAWSSRLRPVPIYSSIADGRRVCQTSKISRSACDDPALDVDENSVMVLQGAGPKGYPGMPEVGNMPLPKKLLQRGITDVVRVSDARMSGTAYGTVVLHVTPESAAGGVLALVRNGDEIELDVEARKLELCVPADELERRRAAWTPPPPLASGGYQKLYIDHVLQADRGADFDFLVGSRGSGHTERESLRKDDSGVRSREFVELSLSSRPERSEASAVEGPAGFS